MNQNGLVLTIKDFCREAKISRSLFYNLRDAGKGPKTFNVGRRVLITREAAVAWVAEMQTDEGQHSSIGAPEDISSDASVEVPAAGGSPAALTQAYREPRQAAPIFKPAGLRPLRTW